MCRDQKGGLAVCSTLLFGCLIGLGTFCTCADAASVLFVGNEQDFDDVPGIAGNESVIDRLTELGHDVEAIDDDDAMFVDPQGKDLIVISSSSASSAIGFHYTDVQIPIIQWESALWDEMFMSTSGPNIADQTAIDVVEVDHPLAELMGLTELGEVEIRDEPTTFHGGNRDQFNLAPDAVLIAQEVGNTSPLVAVIEEGGELTDGSLAMDIRIMLFHGDEALDGVNDIGLSIFDGAVHYALGDLGPPVLRPGDADQDLDFDQLDIVKVLVAAKYLTGQPATWGEGDWDGAPGGSPGSPPLGNGLFDQVDVIAALADGTYLTGPHAALAADGNPDDEQTSLVYVQDTGELRVDAPVSTQLTSIFVTSAGNRFVGDKPPVLDGPFDSFAADNIFKSTIGSSFGDSSFGNVLPAGLSEEDVVADLSASGSLAGGGGLGDVDLIYVPEPGSLLLLVVGAVFGMLRSRKHRP